MTPSRRCQPACSLPAPSARASQSGGRTWWLAGRSFGGPPSRYAHRWTAFMATSSEGWAHFELTRINTHGVTASKPSTVLAHLSTCVVLAADRLCAAWLRRHPFAPTHGRWDRQRELEDA